MRRRSSPSGRRRRGSASRPGRKNLRTVAAGLAQGLSQADALRQAGYADTTIDKNGYQIVRRPQVQNFLTEALEAIGVTARTIMKPIKDGLEACEVVRTETGKLLTTHPDHKIRLMAHDRAVSIYGLAGKSGDRAEHEPPPVAPVNLQINFVSPQPRRDEPPPPGVRFVNTVPRREDGHDEEGSGREPGTRPR